jgi:hypothetical protein
MTIVGATGKGVVGYPFKNVIAAKAAADDTLLFTDPGVIIDSIVSFSVGNTGAATSDTFGYNIVKVQGAHAGTATTSIIYDNATANTRPVGSYYLFNANTGEMIWVIKDSGYTTTTGTLTVVRGVLGTTAVAIADNENLHIMNSIILRGATVGLELVSYKALPSLAKSNFFA